MVKHAAPVWLITGRSTSFGHALAQVVLGDGWRADVTARDNERVADPVEKAGDRALALDLDVTDQSQIEAVVTTTRGRFGRIDVLVNNAGYGYEDDRGAQQG